MVKAGIYTRKGDGGQTSLASREKVSKSHHRIQALGSVDELNALIGLLIGYSPSCFSAGYGEAAGKKFYRSLQEDLFVIGSIIGGAQELEVDQERIAYLEEYIDECSAKLVPLRNFILPGGDVESCWLHLARTVCRRAERDIVVVNELESGGGPDDERGRTGIHPNVLIYMNRLSDLLFVLARKANKNGESDILWRKESPLKGT